MRLKRIARGVFNFILFIKIKAFFCLLTPFSIHFVNKLAELLGWLGFYAAFPRRRTALRNLDIAFGNSKTKEEKKKIAIESFQNLIKGVFELHYYYVRGPAEINRRFSYEGFENYTEALKKGPILFISAHLGQFPLMVCKFVSDGHKVYLILKEVANSHLERMFNMYRRRITGTGKLYSILIYYKPRFLSLKRSLRELRRGHSLFIFVDQKFSRGIKTHFFGREILAPPGADTLARKSGATVLPAFIVREGTKHKIHIGKPISISSDERENAQKFNDQVEMFVKKYPGQWWWFHKKWW